MKPISSRKHTSPETPCDAVPVIEIVTETNSLTGERCINCRLVWTGVEVDRPHTGGISLLDTPHYRSLAERYRRAVAEGAVYSNPRIVSDINGRTYIRSDGFVMGKYLNSDLKALGY